MQMGILVMLLFVVSDLFADSCPLKGTATAHIMVFQVDSPAEGGWRPYEEMTVDVTLQNISDSTITAIRLSVNYESVQNYAVALTPGQSVMLYYNPALGIGQNAIPPITVLVQQVKYADGMLVDVGSLCSFKEPPPSASALVVPSSQFTTCPESSAILLPSTDQELITAGISPPRIIHQNSLPVSTLSRASGATLFLEEMVSPRGAAPRLWPTIPIKRGTVVFSYIIASNGTTCDITIKQGSWGEKVDQAEIELLKESVYFPAVKKNVPISVRVDVPMTQ
jgi:hypothetical protein